ncbi:MAG: cation-transporting ATPase [Brachybacterium tyrofermentans]|uniref:Cation-transporting ATPase n=1 Tax=Brachybacterium tyrofermentans TaxID=47848 RepID=A0ABW0FLC0_9MICO|nr:cation-transporting ATPase [Brachybacterium tyrofermentans]SLN01284.1 expressed protein [Corynebacterium xerosis]
MGTINRLFGMAKQAIDQNSSSQDRSSGSSKGSDWRTMVRSAADAFTGEGDRHDQRGGRRTDPTESRSEHYAPRRAQHLRRTGGPQGSGLSDTDRRAIARYDYLVRTAEPDQLEQVHREAFERLTPEQRAQLGSTMQEELPLSERPRSDAPQDLARSATRLGVLDPRKLTSLLTRSGRGPDVRSSAPRTSADQNGSRARGAGVFGVGAIGTAGLLGVVAGGAVVTSIGGALLQDALGEGIDVDSLTEGLGEDLGGLPDGVEGLGSIEELEGLGGSVTDIGEQASGFGDQVSDLGLGDLFGR